MTRQTDSSYPASQGLAKRMPVAATWGNGPEGVLIPGERAQNDTIAVVYDKGESPPIITITNVSDSVQAVHANGVAVAVVARADGPHLATADVLLVERFVTRPA